jgi:hypothetical protein
VIYKIIFYLLATKKWRKSDRKTDKVREREREREKKDGNKYLVIGHIFRKHRESKNRRREKKKKMVWSQREREREREREESIKSNNDKSRKLQFSVCEEQQSFQILSFDFPSQCLDKPEMRNFPVHSFLSFTNI